MTLLSSPDFDVGISIEQTAKDVYQYAFLDSGSGGLPYLAQLRSQAHTASCVYLADTLHFPYGEKTREQVIEYASAAIDQVLHHFSPSVIIIACNTISVAALAVLRTRFSIPFVGTVPAIKLASARSQNRKIGILATERTVLDPYTDELIQTFAPDCEIMRIGDSSLIGRIEAELVTADTDERIAAVRPSIERFREAGVDTIVLACTHFLHVTDEIHEVAGPGIEIIDSREGVIQQTLRLVPPATNDHGNAACFISGGVSSDIEDRYKTYSRLFNIEWGGIL